MAKKVTLIDLSAPLSNADPEPLLAPKIAYMGHEESARVYGEAWGLRPEDFPQGRFAAVETVTLSTHSGTHLDAPWHYGPTSGGRPARTIDQVPLEWCYSDGVVLDFSHKKAGEAITREEVQEALRKIGYQLKPLDIVLIRTDTYKHFHEPGYEDRHPGMTREATRWLLEQGIRVVGIDAWGWDRPFKVMVEEVKQGRKDRLWEAHFVGKEIEYCHLEKMANLDQIPRPYGFKVAVFPVKIEKASAAWVRAVAIVEE